MNFLARIRRTTIIGALATVAAFAVTAAPAAVAASDLVVTTASADRVNYFVDSAVRVTTVVRNDGPDPAVNARIGFADVDPSLITAQDPASVTCSVGAPVEIASSNSGIPIPATDAELRERLGDFADPYGPNTTETHRSNSRACETPSLAVGATMTMTATYYVDRPNPSRWTTWYAGALYDHQGGDPNVENNGAPISIVVKPEPADVSVIARAATGGVEIGVRNDGPADVKRGDANPITKLLSPAAIARITGKGIVLDPDFPFNWYFMDRIYLFASVPSSMKVAAYPAGCRAYPDKTWNVMCRAPGVVARTTRTFRLKTTGSGTVKVLYEPNPLEGEDGPDLLFTLDPDRGDWTGQVRIGAGGSGGTGPGAKPKPSTKLGDRTLVSIALRSKPKPGFVVTTKCTKKRGSCARVTATVTGSGAAKGQRFTVRLPATKAGRSGAVRVTVAPKQLTALRKASARLTVAVGKAKVTVKPR